MQKTVNKFIQLEETTLEEYNNLRLLSGVLPPAPQGMRHSVWLIHGDYPHFSHLSPPVHRAVMEIKAIVDEKGKYCDYDMLYTMTRSVVDKLKTDLYPPAVNAHITGRGQIQLYLTSLFPPYAYGMPSKIWREALLEEMQDLIELGKDMGVSFAGFGALTGTGKRIQQIADNPIMPVNDGNILTAIGILDSLIKAFEYRNLTFKNTKIAIIGATGSVGTSLCRLMLGMSCNLVLTAKSNKQKLNVIAEIMRNHGSKVEERLGVSQSLDAVKNSDVVIILTGDPMLKYTKENFSNEVKIICDATRPHVTDFNLPNEFTDALVYDGPTVIFPGKMLYPDIFGLEENELLCCMSQNSLLAEAGINSNFAVYPTVFKTEEEVKEFFFGQLSDDIAIVEKVFASSGSKFSDYFRWHEWILYPTNKRYCSRAIAISGFIPK